MEGNENIDALMMPVLDAIRRHVKDKDAITDIYNRAYEAIIISMDVKDMEISNLRSEVSALREQVRWRKYPEEMPKRDGFYLVLENVNQVAGYYHLCKQFGWNTDGGRINIQTVTHWMPLPQLPEAE